MLKPMGKKHVPHHSRLEDWRSLKSSPTTSLPAPLRPLFVPRTAAVRLQLRYQQYQDKVRTLLKKPEAPPHESRGNKARKRREKRDVQVTTSSLTLAVALKTSNDEKKEPNVEKWTCSKVKTDWHMAISLDPTLQTASTSTKQPYAANEQENATNSDAKVRLSAAKSDQMVFSSRQFVNIMDSTWLLASITQRWTHLTSSASLPSCTLLRHVLNLRLLALDLIFIARSGGNVNFLARKPASPATHCRHVHSRLQQVENLSSQHVTRVLTSLQSDLWLPAVRFLGWLLTKTWRVLFHGLYVDVTSLNQLRQLLEKEQQKQDNVHVVLAPTHKSHLDYLILSYVCFGYGLPLPRIAAGNNLNLPFLGAFLRANGSFFIRRSFRNDFTYKQVVEAYVHELVDDGNPIEVFLEGGRSRHGRINAPRFGFLSMFHHYVEQNDTKTLWIVPIALDYDKVYEVEGYVNQVLGTPKTNESLWGLLRSLKDLMSTRLGHAYVRIGEPVALTATSSLEETAALVAERMQTSGTVTSSALVAALLLWKRVYMTETMLKTCFDWLVSEFTKREAVVTPLIATEDVVTSTLALLNVAMHAKVVICRFEMPSRALELGFYRNQVAHVFLLEMAVFGALDVALQGREGVQKVDRTGLEVQVGQNWALLGHFYRPKRIELETGVIHCLASAPGCNLDAQWGTIGVDTHVWYTSKLRSFVLSLYWPLIDSLWLTTQGLWGVLDATQDVTEMDFVCSVQRLANGLLRRKQLVHAEALCSESIKQSLEYLNEINVVKLEARIVRLCSPSGDQVHTLTHEVNRCRKPETFLWRQDQVPLNLTRNEALELMQVQ